MLFLTNWSNGHLFKFSRPGGLFDSLQEFWYFATIPSHVTLATLKLSDTLLDLLYVSVMLVEITSIIIG